MAVGSDVGIPGWNRMNQFEDMRIFLHIVETGGFSAAAGALHISPAKVSTHLARLEKLLKVRLVDRSRRTISVTEEGRRYYEHCRKVLAEVDAMNDTLAGTAQAPAGLLRVEVASLLTNQLLLPVLHRFFEEHPGITLELIHTNHLLDLGHETCDLMIRAGPVDDSSLIGLPIGTVRSVVAAAPAYLARRGMPQTPEDLLLHNCLQMVDPNTGRILDWSFHRDGMNLDIRTRGNLIFNEGEAKIEAALLGYGIYYGMEFPILQYLEAGRLQLLLGDFQDPKPRPLLLAYPRNDHPSAKLRAFVDFLRKAYPSDQEIRVPVAG